MTNRQTFVSFFLGQHLFALQATHILEILRRDKITSIPKTNPYIKGIVNFRGTIIPIFDTYLKFNIIDVPDTNKREIIVLEHFKEDRSLQFGILADKMNEVEFVSELDIQTVPEKGNPYTAELIAGAYKHNNRFAMIIHIDKLITF